VQLRIELLHPSPRLAPRLLRRHRVVGHAQAVPELQSRVVTTRPLRLRRGETLRVVKDTMRATALTFAGDRLRRVE
jgi:hypothetical protein